MDYRLKIGEEIIPVQCLIQEEGNFTTTIDGQQTDIVARRISPFQMHLMVNGKGINVFTNGNPEAKELLIKGKSYVIEDADILEQRAVRTKSAGTTPGDIVPPMPSVVIRILAAEGDQVEKSQPLVVVAAMKMETTLSAPYAGTVTKIHVNEGDKVAAKQVLMDIAQEET
ncbi:MAG: hypothetical protein GY795_15135 [Desulfobacterales bacterium]|nr:hypothetical protein [Desulfobacterales bacterium]